MLNSFFQGQQLTRTESDKQETLISLFETSVKKYPDGIALITEDGVSLTYKQLHSRANSIAKKIKARTGADGRAHLIGIMMDRSVGFIAAILGTLLAEATYVPVDPAFPPDRQTHILNHSNCELTIIDHKNFTSSTSLGVILPPCLIIDPISCAILDEKDNKRVEPNESLQQTPESLAYVLYTSGSTGKPKGVVIYDTGAVNIITWFANELNIGPHSRVMGITTFCFDISVLEVFLPLIRGGTLVLANSSTQKDPFRLLDVMQEQRVTVFQATPTTYEMMLATGWKGDFAVDFLVGGEACRPSVIPIAHRCRSLRNVYGPTETTIWSSSFTITEEFATEVEINIRSGDSAPAVPVGTPISKTDFYIVNIDNGDPTACTAVQCLPGTEGELWIGGSGVARGYLNADHLTAEKFFRNPFGNGMVYRTGDVVRKREDDTYVFSRRLDDQVKIDGFRIELAEIEIVYGRHPMVEQAVALVRNNRLVLYVKSKSENTSELTEQMLDSIHTTAKTSLPYYMIPKQTVQVHSFPQTANGKLDRKALPDLPDPIPDQHLTDSLTEPSSQQEESIIGLLDEYDRRKQDKSKRTMSFVVCDVVEEIRGVRPSTSSTLAALGVDSLGSVMVVRRLSDTFGGMKIAPSTIFIPGQTISTLAKALRDRILKEKPELISSFEEEEESCDVENGAGVKITDLDTEVQGANAAEISFDESIGANIKLFEGCRGFLALLVLWEHYHHPQYEINFAVAADSGMFMIVAGLTVALQFRIAPVHVGRVDSGVRLKPRRPFNLASFLTGKFIGIFPLLWLTLLLCIPNWYMNEPKHKDDPLCYPLWVLGLQTMSRECVNEGPYGIWFASALVVVLIIYAVTRSIIGQVQDHIILSRNKDFVVPFTNPNNIERLNKARTINEYFGNMIARVSFNRPNFREALFLTGFWFCFTFVGLSLAGFHRPKGYGITEKSPSSNVPFFFAGVSCASLIESWHFLVFPLASIDEYFSAGLLSVFGNNNSCFNPTDIKIFSGDLKTVISILWRFLPDFIVCVFVLFCSSLGSFGTDKVAKTSMWLTLPMIFLAFLSVSIIQKGAARSNLSRWVLESYPLAVCGYSSLNLFLFQHIFIEFYAPMSTGTIWYKSAKNKWFHNLPLTQRLFWVFCLICVSYLAQWIIQDRLVMYIYGKLVDYRKAAKK